MSDADCPQPEGAPQPELRHPASDPVRLRHRQGDKAARGSVSMMERGFNSKHLERPNILLYFLLLYYYVKIMIWDLLFILQTYLLLTLQLRDQCHFISVNSTNFQCSTNRCVL